TTGEAEARALSRRDSSRVVRAHGGRHLRLQKLSIPAQTPAPLRSLCDLTERHRARVAIERREDLGDRIGQLAPSEIVERVAFARGELDARRPAVRRLARSARVRVALLAIAEALAAILERRRGRVGRKPARRMDGDVAVAPAATPTTTSSP